MSDRTPETDEVLRRVGRNLVIFQQVEQALKFLTTHARFHAPAREFAERFDRHTRTIHKKTMGQLAGSLEDFLLDQPDAAPEDIEQEDIDHAWFGFRFSIETDTETVARCGRELKDLVDRRNELVHHFLPRWQTSIVGEPSAALSWLDDQREAAVAVLDRLRTWAHTVEAASREHAAFLTSGDGQREIELFLLRSSRLVVMLGQVAMATPRADGWTLLSTAGNLIKRDSPEELQDLRKRFGQASLKAIMLATELFDVTEETTANGGTRTIYRINERWRLETPSAELPIQSSRTVT